MLFSIMALECLLLTRKLPTAISFICFLISEPDFNYFSTLALHIVKRFQLFFCQIRSSFSANELMNFTLVTLELSPVNSSDLFVNPLTKDLTFQSFVVEGVQNKILYWKMPQEYTGNKVGLQRHFRTVFIEKYDHFH